MNVIGIQRAERFSPNSVDRDLAIITAVTERMNGIVVREEDISSVQFTTHPDIVFSMARGKLTLDLLDSWQKAGTLVINPAAGVRQCGRSALDKIMQKNHIPVPTKDMDEGLGWWIKRADGSAQTRGDVVFCKSAKELSATRTAMAGRGITNVVVQPHVAGDLVKFYGIEGTGFFRKFYPGDDGESKFGDEEHNGRPHHYFFDTTRLQHVAELTSRLVGVPVYGGDAIIRPDGGFVIIDFNDWPSFSRCRAEAAEAIVSLARYSI